MLGRLLRHGCSMRQIFQSDAWSWAGARPAVRAVRRRTSCMRLGPLGQAQWLDASSYVQAARASCYNTIKYISKTTEGRKTPPYGVTYPDEATIPMAHWANACTSRLL